jgi:hypothetical protein
MVMLVSLCLAMKCERHNLSKKMEIFMKLDMSKLIVSQSALSLTAMVALSSVNKSIGE